MQHRERRGPKHYRLEMRSVDRGEVRVIEFDAQGAESALWATERHGGGREVTIFEDGRPLSRLRHSAQYGFWIIAPGIVAAA